VTGTAFSGVGSAFGVRGFSVRRSGFGERRVFGLLLRSRTKRGQLGCEVALQRVSQVLRKPVDIFFGRIPGTHQSGAAARANVCIKAPAKLV